MRKLLAVVKREYVQRVRTKFFVIMTVLGPFMLVVFTIVPGLLFSVKAGGDTRIAIVDQTEGMKLYDSIRNSLLNNNFKNRPDHVPARATGGITRTIRSGFRAFRCSLRLGLRALVIA
jgi:ABC-2 type transport system permease protein